MAIKIKLTNQPPTKFWKNVQNPCPTLARETLEKLLPVATTYLCETKLSHYVSTKTKYRNISDAKADMYIQLSRVTPEIRSIFASLQAHPSH